MKDDNLEGLGIFLLGLAALITILVIAGIVWFILSSIVAACLYIKHLQEAKRTFDQIAAEVGVDFPTDEMVQALWGAGVDLPEDGFDDPAAWMAGTPIGISIGG